MASAAPVVFRKLRRKAMICRWWASDDRSRKVYAIAALLSHRFLLYLSQFARNVELRLGSARRLKPAMSVGLISRNRNHKCEVTR
jgi:hypothetical protein